MLSDKLNWGISEVFKSFNSMLSDKLNWGISEEFKSFNSMLSDNGIWALHVILSSFERMDLNKNNSSVSSNISFVGKAIFEFMRSES